MNQLAGNGVGQIHMMVDLVTQLIISPQFFRNIALLCPELYNDALFVDCGPVFDLILKFIDNIAGIIREVIHT